MNIDKMVNMILIKLSQDHNIFYMERRSYKDNRVFKSFIIKIDDNTEEFNSKKDLLLYIKEMI